MCVNVTRFDTENPTKSNQYILIRLNRHCSNEVTVAVVLTRKLLCVNVNNVDSTCSHRVCRNWWRRRKSAASL